MFLFCMQPRRKQKYKICSHWKVLRLLQNFFRPWFHVKWGPALAGKEKSGMVHSVSLRTRGVQVKLRSLENACHTRALYRCDHDKALYVSAFTFTFTLHSVSCLAMLWSFFSQFVSKPVPFTAFLSTNTCEDALAGQYIQQETLWEKNQWAFYVRSNMLWHEVRHVLCRLIRYCSCRHLSMLKSTTIVNLSIR